MGEQLKDSDQKGDRTTNLLLLDDLVTTIKRTIMLIELEGNY